MNKPIKFVYTIRSANGVIINSLRVNGHTQEEADQKIKQMYRHCDIISCEQQVFYKTINPNYVDVLDSIIQSELS